MKKREQGQKNHRDWCNKPLIFKTVLRKRLNSSAMKVWIYLLSTSNDRNEGVGVTLLPLFNGEDNGEENQQKYYRTK